MSDNTCQNCLYPGNGKCPDCNGSGLIQNPIDAVSRALADEDQYCETCNGTGDCQSCDGKGYN